MIIPKEEDNQDLRREYGVMQESEDRPEMVRKMAMWDAQRCAGRHGDIGKLAADVRKALVLDYFNKAVELNLLEKRDWENYDKAFK